MTDKELENRLTKIELAISFIKQTINPKDCYGKHSYADDECIICAKAMACHDEYLKRKLGSLKAKMAFRKAA